MSADEPLELLLGTPGFDLDGGYDHIGVARIMPGPFSGDVTMSATTAQAQEAHAFIRGLLVRLFDEATARGVRIQYGGSVKPSNARELMSQPDVDGALVGGASLEALSFAEIVKNSI